MKRGKRPGRYPEPWWQSNVVFALVSAAIGIGVVALLLP